MTPLACLRATGLDEFDNGFWRVGAEKLLEKCIICDVSARQGEHIHPLGSKAPVPVPTN